MAERYYGEDAFEDLMSRAESTEDGWTSIADLAAELHINVDVLADFAAKHLTPKHYNEAAGRASEEGTGALRTFLSQTFDPWEDR